MITLDFKSEAPIQKSHDWLDVDTMGIWRIIKDFSYLPDHIVRMESAYSQALFDGDSMIVYDHDYNYYLVIFNENGYKTRSFGYGTSIEVLNNGNIIMQTETDLYCVDRNLNDIWHISRDGRGYTWYDRENNILYSPQGSSIDAIDPDTGTIIKSGSLPYNDFAAVKVGNYILTPRRNTNKTFDLDLNLVDDSFNAGGYADVLALPKLAGDGYWIGSYALNYYSDVILARFNMNTDGTFKYVYSLPTARSLGLGVDGTGDLINFDRIGTKHDKYWAFVKDNGFSDANHSKFGYVPVAEEVSMTYAINTTKKVLYAVFDNKTPVVNIHNQGVEDFYYYYVYISKDLSNWTQIENMQDLSGLDLSGTIYLKIVWNPESFTVPILKPFYVIEEGSIINYIKTVKAFTRQFRRAII